MIGVTGPPIFISCVFCYVYTQGLVKSRTYSDVYTQALVKAGFVVLLRKGFLARFLWARNGSWNLDQGERDAGVPGLVSNDELPKRRSLSPLICLLVHMIHRATARAAGNNQLGDDTFLVEVAVY